MTHIADDDRRTSPVRIVHVEDLPGYRYAFQMLIKDAGPEYELVGDADRPETALDLVRSTEPDVVVIDLRFPNSTACWQDLVTKLIEQFPDIGILVHSEWDESEMKRRVYEAHVHAFVSKGSEPAQLLDAIRDVARGRRAGERPPPPVPRQQQLTQRETEVARLAAHGKDNAEIAKELGIEVRTVESHLYNAREKLDMKSREMDAWYRQTHPDEF